ncbi:MAG: hypothetical protein ACI9JN_000948 [Bacteroidia bacterium]|jgi:hypothetical protein
MLMNKTLVITVGDFTIVDLISKTIDDRGVSNLFISEMKHSNMEEIKKEVKIAALKAAKVKARYLLESVGEK